MNEKAGNSHRYDDIIGLKHPVSKVHPPMARWKRAAQFAAFDALSGFTSAISEAGRKPEERKELSEDMIDMSNERLAVIGLHIKEQPNISVTYFLPDERKAGGRYVTVSGNVKNLDGIERVLILTDKTQIPIDDIRMIDGDLFESFY